MESCLSTPLNEQGPPQCEGPKATRLRPPEFGDFRSEAIPEEEPATNRAFVVPTSKGKECPHSIPKSSVRISSCARRAA